VKINLRILIATSFVLSLAVLASLHPAKACSPVMSKGAFVAVAREAAIIVWDEKAKRQHFIRRAAFDTKVPYFGFLVPTPTQPALKEAPDKLFQEMEDWTKPEVVTQVIRRERHPMGRAMMATNVALPDSVAVLTSQHVAGYDAVVLKATDAKALEEWLQKHGYATRPELTRWLEPYIKQGWIITAFQIPKPDATINQVSTSAVLMSFDTERPFFPYSEPADQRTGTPAPGSRLLRVFFVGTRRMQGALEDKKTAWPGRTVWAGQLPTHRRESLSGAVKKIGVSVPDNAHLTVFEDSSSPRLGTADLFFSPSVDQSVVRRPAIINYLEVDAPHAGVGDWKMGAVVLGSTVAVLAAICLIVRLSLKKTAPPVD
jgi:hypothetical protein